MKRRITQLGYDLLFIIPLAVMAVSFTMPRLPFELPFPAESPVWLVTATLTLLYITFMRHLTSRERKWLIGGLATLILLIFFLVPAGERISFVREYRILFFEMAGAVLLTFTGMFLNRHRMIRELTAAALAVALVFSLVYSVQVSKLTVGMILLYALLALADEIQRRQIKEGDTEPAKHLVCISMFILAVFLASVPFKAPDNPYDWSFVRRIARSVQGRLIILGESLFPETGWDSSEPAIGFSDSSSFGGALGNTDHTVLILDTRTDLDPFLYLGGRVFDTFDGRNWNSVSHGELDERGLDTIETMSAAMDYFATQGADGQDAEKTGSARDFLRESSFDMKYKDIVTTSLFIPAKCLPSGYLGSTGEGLLQPATSSDEPLQIDGAEIRFSKKKLSREKITLSYYKLNAGHSSFAKLLDTEHTVSERSWNEALAQLNMEDVPGYSYDDYERYRKDIYSYYLPETIVSDEVKTLIGDVLEGTETDREKLARIEWMLSDLSYTTRPGELPDDLTDSADFLDHFLLDTKTGYCTHFATAFVLLARANGIPARLVQGFRFPAGRLTRIEVSSSSAHAWAEAYLDGIGWFVYESVPGYRSVSSWLTEADWDRMNAIQKENASTVDYAVSSPAETADEPEEPEKPPFVIMWYQIAIPVLAGALLILILYALDVLIRKRRYARMSIREKCFYLCGRILDILKKRGFGRKEDETLSEYRRRVLVSQALSEHLAFIDIYEELLYADRTPTEEDLMTLESALRFYESRRVKKKV